jgi:DNA-directed RNA polymerase I and III subunit RPAC2
MLYSPDVEFCGYSIPHPSEAKMNLRIQTYGQLIQHIRIYEQFS